MYFTSIFSGCLLRHTIRSVHAKSAQKRAEAWAVVPAAHAAVMLGLSTRHELCGPSKRAHDRNDYLHAVEPIYGIGAILIQPAAHEAALIGLHGQNLDELQLLVLVLLELIHHAGVGGYTQVLE